MKIITWSVDGHPISFVVKDNADLIEQYVALSEDGVPAALIGVYQCHPDNCYDIDEETDEVTLNERYRDSPERRLN